MKYILLLLLPFVGFSNKIELLPDYLVGNTTKDPKLKNTESCFHITFHASGKVLTNEVIKSSFNGFESDLKTNLTGSCALKVKAGKYKFQFFYNKKYFEVFTDSILSKKGCRTYVDVYFHSSRSDVMVKKPVIYIYSPDTMDVSIKLKTKEKPSFMYPYYADNWKVKATPAGDLITNKAVYPYLFWEGNIPLQASDINTNEGYIVSNENLISFFEEKLNEMGLTQTEKTDFITFWCPQMAEHKITFVHFVFNSEINRYAELDVNPKPQNIFRVYMIWTPIESINFNRITKKQVIPKVKRDGLTIIEWGGSQMPELYK